MGLAPKAEDKTQEPVLMVRGGNVLSPVKWTHHELAQVDRATRKIVPGSPPKRLSGKGPPPQRPGRQGHSQPGARVTVSAAAYLLNAEDDQVAGAMRLAREREQMGQDTTLAMARRVLHNYEVRPNSGWN